ncbi:hypothetical protein K502DRAFT_340671 [Neoconidiobolus thromboides FSU 785]|nr:hypothetical protein K502DRAFT_340671 [Neoconidiobolus thromboides FSU 785]
MFPVSRMITRVARRGLATRSYIPPNLAGKTVASPAAQATGAEATNVDDLVYIYRQLPKGPAPKNNSKASGPLEWYRQRYFEGENASATPIVHFIATLFILGYYMEYVNHLSHHKNVKHH